MAIKQDSKLASEQLKYKKIVNFVDIQLAFMLSRVIENCVVGVVGTIIGMGWLNSKSYLRKRKERLKNER